MKISGIKTLVIAFCFVFPALKSQAQENVIKTNPLPAIWGQVPLTGEYRLVYERALTEKHAVWLGPAFVGPSQFINIEKATRDSVNNNTGIAVRGFRIQGGYKYYLAGEGAPDGLYVGPYLSYNRTRFINKENRNEFVEAQFASICGIIGYQLIIEDIVAVDFFTGAGYKNNSWNYRDPQGFFDRNVLGGGRNHLKLILGFNIGIAF